MRLSSQRPFFLTFALLLLVSFLFQPFEIHAATPRRDMTGTPGIPRLIVRGAETPVQLQSLAIQTRVQNSFAETSLDMTFYNPNRRILEGELQFPLLPGQEISGISLDINGKLRAGTPVNKARGQEVFEEITRRKVDPALLEATKGNSYKLRVYPIPANGTRRVVIRILQPLTPEKGIYRYRLPLAFAKNLANFSLEAIVASPKGTPTLTGNKLGLTLKPVGMLYQGKVEKTNITPEGWLDISLPSPDSLADSITATSWGENTYFSAAALIPVKTQARTLPGLATIVWDASSSGSKRDHAREFQLLDRYFKAFGTGEIRLIVVRNKAEEPQTFAIKKGNWSQLKAALNNLVYDGGTDLASWKPTDDCKEYLLFSDGLANFGNSLGERTLPKLNTNQRLFPIAASLEADYTALRHAAGGRPVIDLLQNTPEQAAAKLLKEGIRVTLDTNILAGQGQAALDPQSQYLMGASGKNQGKELVRFAGWVKNSSAPLPSITVQVHYPDGSTRNIKVKLPAQNKAGNKEGEPPLPARLWARFAIAELEGNYQRNKSSIERISQEYGVISRNTSLIVLETAADYVRYNITPPADMQAEVANLRQRWNPRQADKRLSDRQLLAMWQEKVNWWKTDFPLTEKLQSSSAAVGAVDDTHRQRMMSPPRPSPAAKSEAMSEMAVAAEAPRQEMREDAKAAAPASAGNNAAPQANIQIKPWQSDAPYIVRLRDAKDADLYAIYLDERPGYQQSSAFFIDVADRLFERGMNELGLRVLSNLAELELENRQLMRMLAYRLIQAREYTFAQSILARVRELAPHEPQSTRDLALVQAALGKTQEAVDLLYDTATRRWDSRFGEINTIALTEMNAFIALAKTPVNTSAMNRELLTNLASDLRVVLSWDTDNVDMDLWVTDPTGETANFTNRFTKQGGRLSTDCRQGYGPEEFMLRNAKPGVYKVEVEYFGSSQQTLAGEVTLKLNLFTGFGTPEQKEAVTTMRLKNKKGRILVGEFTIGK